MIDEGVFAGAPLARNIWVPVSAVQFFMLGCIGQGFQLLKQLFVVTLGEEATEGI